MTIPDTVAFRPIPPLSELRDTLDALEVVIKSHHAECVVLAGIGAVCMVAGLMLFIQENLHYENSKNHRGTGRLFTCIRAIVRWVSRVLRRKK